MGKKTDQSNPLESFKLTSDEVKALEDRIRASTLPEPDQKLVISLIATVIALRTMVLRGRAGMLKLLRMIFGAKTEKQKKSPMRVTP